MKPSAGSRWFRLAAAWIPAAALLAAAPGCAAPRPVAMDDAAAGRLEIALGMTAPAELRHTYFEVSESGELRFAGGREAVARGARPVGRLSALQRRELADIVGRHRLFEAGGSSWTRGRKVNYDLELRVGDVRHRFRCIDDEAPGVRQLHEALFRMHREMAYREP